MTQVSAPYGITLGAARQNPTAISAQQITDMQNVCNGGWIRWQLEWLTLEDSPNHYTWSNVLDGAVAACNAAASSANGGSGAGTGNGNAVNLLLPIQYAPTWRISIDVTNGNYIGPTTLATTAIAHGIPITSISIAALPAGSIINDKMVMNIGMEGNSVQESFQINNAAGYSGGATSLTVCKVGDPTTAWTPANDHPITTTYITGDQLTGNYGLADPTAYKNFAVLVAQRYNGSGGHGRLDAIQCGNEEFDAHGGNLTQRDYQGTLGSLTLLQVYPALRDPAQGNYQGIIGMGAMCGTFTGYYNHTLNWHNNLFANGVAAMVRGDTQFFTDFHFYRSKVGWVDPTLSSLPGSPDFPSIAETISRIQQSYAANNISPQLWCNEFGWAFCNTYNGPGARGNDIYYTDTFICTQAQQRDYSYSMWDALRNGKAARGMIFTENPASTAQYGQLPHDKNNKTLTDTFLSSAPRGLYLTFTADSHDPTPPGSGGGGIFLLAWTDPASGKGFKEYAAAHPSWSSVKALSIQCHARFNTQQLLRVRIKGKFVTRGKLTGSTRSTFKINSPLKPISLVGQATFLVGYDPIFALFPATSRRTGGFPTTHRRTGQLPNATRRTGVLPPTSRRQS